MDFKEDAQSFARYRDNVLRVENGAISNKARQEYEERLRDNFIGRTGLTLSVRRFKQRDFKPEQERRKGKTRIVCVSAPFEVGEGKDLLQRSFRDGCKLVQLTDPKQASAWLERREQELVEALGLTPDVVCFGELAYPPPPPSEDNGWDVDLIREYGARRIDFEDQVRRYLRRRNSNAFVFLGTFHCLMTLYNVGVAFPWGPSTDGVKVEVADEWLDAKEKGEEIVQQTPPVTLRKRFPARRAGEVTRTPPQPTFDVFFTEFGRVGVLICSDIVDLNQFLTVARWNTPTDKYANIDYILVPSYNDSKKLVSMCQELSYIAATTVIVTNANPGNADFPETQLFCCGLGIPDLAQLSALKSMVTVHQQTVSFSGAVLNIFDIDIKRARNFRDSEQRKSARRRNGRKTARPSANIEQLPKV